MAEMRAQAVLELRERVTATARKVMAALQKLKGSMDKIGRSRGSDQASNALRRQEVVARKLRMEYGKLSAAMDRVRSKGAGLFKRGGMLGAGALAAKGAVAVGLVNQIMGPAIEMERFRMQLDALEGSSARGKAALEWIKDFARRTPLEIADVTASYAKMKAMGLDPTNGSMQALVDTMAMYGQGSEGLDRMVLAVGQAWSKQKLQGEEAMQLTELGIPVWDLLAKKLGKTSAEVMKMAEKGKLGRDAITLLIEAMGEMSKGSSEKVADAWEGVMSNISDAWYQFRVAIAESGPFKLLKDNLKGILDEINRMAANGQLKALAEDIGGRLTEFLSKAAEAAKAFWKAAVKVAEVIDRVATAVGGYENLTYLAIGLFAVSTSMQAIVAVAEAAMILKTIAAVATGGAGAGLLGIAAGIAAIAGGLAVAQHYEPTWLDKINDMRPAGEEPMAPRKSFKPENQMMIGGATSAALGQLARERVVAAFGELQTAIRAKLADVMAMVRTVGPQLVSAVTTGLGSLFSVGARWMASLLDGIKAKVAEIIAYVSGIGSSVSSAIGSIAGGASIGTPTPQPQGGGRYGKARAAGGSIYKGDNVLVGERGPEVLSAQRYGHVTPNHKLGGGSTTINLGGLTFNGKATPAEATRFAALLMQRLRAGLHDGAYA